MFQLFFRAEHFKEAKPHVQQLTSASNKGVEKPTGAFWNFFMELSLLQYEFCGTQIIKCFVL
jgi:hypothetical protein